VAVGPHPPPPSATAATARPDVRHGVHIGWRRPRRSRAPTLAIGALGVLLAAGRPASAQYLNSYKAGLEAIEAKDWARAAASMHQAIADRKEEKAKLPVRLFLRPYLPHLYLGYARFESGDCAGALAAWAESERQGVAPRLQEFDLARRGRRECGQRDQQRALAQARQNAQRSLARTVASGEALLERSRAAETRDLWTAGDPSAAQRHQSALGLLEQARAVLADATVDENGIRRAESFVRDADASFTALAVDLDRSIEATRQPGLP